MPAQVLQCLCILLDVWEDLRLGALWAAAWALPAECCLDAQGLSCCQETAVAVPVCLAQHLAAGARMYRQHHCWAWPTLSAALAVFCARRMPGALQQLCQDLRGAVQVQQGCLRLLGHEQALEESQLWSCG